jgi:hypothetical protein
MTVGEAGGNAEVAFETKLIPQEQEEGKLRLLYPELSNPTYKSNCGLALLINCGLRLLINCDMTLVIHPWPGLCNIRGGMSQWRSITVPPG